MVLLLLLLLLLLLPLLLGCFPLYLKVSPAEALAVGAWHGPNIVVITRALVTCGLVS
jgi:hypothetical protein